ncbi:MAG: rRNA pseudouridine synthase [candidate division Zixibacteria bacterium]|jgi:23S rRNA pseudouridine2605 synthase|nr:rRNA pseudouridine synthase [candidate division Zixibacteria bacterium]
MMRINKFLARSGVASRRQAELLVEQGRVKLNGQIIRELGVRVDETKDIVELDGKQVSPAMGAIYLMLNKPPGYLVSSKDPHHDNLVTALLGEYRGKVFPVGRLDYETAGLLLFTNDGELAFRLSHPRFGVKKTYEVVLAGNIGKNELAELDKGIILDDGPTAPTYSVLVSTSKTTSVVRITLHEGRKRQVRRMFEKIGFPVIHLKRIEFGGLKLNNLKEGKFIKLTPSDIMKLRKQVGLA